MPTNLINPAVFAVFQRTKIDVSLRDAEGRPVAFSVNASVLEGSPEVAAVGAARSAERWGVSFAFANIPPDALALPARLWRNGTIKVPGDPFVPTLAIQDASLVSGTLHLVCSAMEGRAKRSAQ